MEEIRDSDIGASQPLALLFLAGWIVLVFVLGFFMLTGHAAAAARTSGQKYVSDESMCTAAHSNSRDCPNAFRM